MIPYGIPVQYYSGGDDKEPEHKDQKSIWQIIRAYRYLSPILKCSGSFIPETRTGPVQRVRIREC